jgi:tRNA A-37 threonylcarbamoyl transferase component Bud32
MDKATLKTKNIKELKTIASEFSVKIPSGTIKDDIINLILTAYRKQKRKARKSLDESIVTIHQNPKESKPMISKPTISKPMISKPKESKATISKLIISKPKESKATISKHVTFTSDTMDSSETIISEDKQDKTMLENKKESTQPKRKKYTKSPTRSPTRQRNVQKNVGAKYNIIEQLGSVGKEGTTFLVEDINGEQYAMKTFSKQKSNKNLLNESEYQKQVASYGIAPNIKYVDETNKYIVMEKLDKNLFDIIKKHNGEIPETIQRKIIKLIKKMDETGIFHGDPNPANFMMKGNNMYMIDFGFARKIDDKLIRKYETNQPNQKFMILGLILKLKEIYQDYNPNIEYKILSNVLHN